MNALYCCAVLALVAACAQAGTRPDEGGRIQPYPKNPYYWQYKGKPVLLLGGSVEDNLFQIPNLKEHLDLLRSVGGNYVRCTMSWRDEGNAWPFARKGAKYDLDQWNGEFWRRFETFLAETARRDIIVQIELWATFDYYRDNWARNPFNPKNNTNYTREASGLPLAVNSHPVRTRNDFFRSVPRAKGLAVPLKYQRRFVKQILLHGLKHDHVLYCMDNETSVTPHWGAYWADFIRRAAARAGKQVETTEMWDAWDLAHRQHSATFDHPDLYTFCDISQNNHQRGQTHYDNALRQRGRIGKRPRPLTCIKVYGADGGRFGTTRDAIERFWRNIFCGLAATRFHRPPSGIGLSPKAQRMIRSAREVTDAFGLFRCEPRNDLLGERSANEAYCLAEAGNQYAVYFPAAGDVTLDTSGARAELSLRWYDIDRGRWLPAQRVGPSARLRLRPPGRGQWAVVLR